MTRQRRAVLFPKKRAPASGTAGDDRDSMRSLPVGDKRGRWPAGSFGIEKEWPGKSPGKTWEPTAGLEGRPRCLPGPHRAKYPPGCYGRRWSGSRGARATQDQHVTPAGDPVYTRASHRPGVWCEWLPAIRCQHPWRLICPARLSVPGSRSHPAALWELIGPQVSW